MASSNRADLGRSLHRVIQKKGRLLSSVPAPLSDRQYLTLQECIDMVGRQKDLIPHDCDLVPTQSTPRVATIDSCAIGQRTFAKLCHRSNVRATTRCGRATTRCGSNKPPQAQSHVSWPGGDKAVLTTQILTPQSISPATRTMSLTACRVSCASRSETNNPGRLSVREAR